MGVGSRGDRAAHIVDVLGGGRPIWSSMSAPDADPGQREVWPSFRTAGTTREVHFVLGERLLGYRFSLPVRNRFAWRIEDLSIVLPSGRDRPLD